MRLFGIAGRSGSGKTTLLEKLLPRLTGRGLRVSVLKHTHHDFDIDRPGKDSFRHREAGASEVLLAGGARWVLMNELRGCPEPTLAEYVAHFSPCDLVLVEGFKQEAIAKLEVYRLANGTPPLWPENPHIVAVAADVSLALPAHLVHLDLNDVDAIAGFILDTVHLGGEKHAVLR
ncbi:MAG TPA: molybdopterin-guanine dinucleotide biosynthesis protein B [Accumulibacter sp.]|uniref:molybdopterin-guanine dinucleotide biosynthesis protein B n=1 Tax=Accumulibacter sp. TaxID=2053492 RepID=UPI0025FA953D|nr:molybdopterin-guanine dinucleotide biosynthesis protein B [Accumulibacter sp.]MCM8598971.1 molybdopterin-guanine dinucleotide biosynthesis protein B [Accumulibacter sp.]MCM8663100.1 molybdopterin-guanine dinucleotide biosynthesis protein B [Accumulibacter sp.]HNC52294.1 molybdopterin-guanine dinucleotide biosynthesis protein B [Accumulibacter sp.]